ncbi:MAG: adenylyltransferase/cytidyltransferase family protein [Ruminococcus flavefaciens]|nr:adenylyltransferase/cytidyltransferase family protein [Roseburia sp.]MCM1231454.1 adenylyltransferase/cytidyltransferase family protein [Ruminococcus flavefaciens]
MSKEKKDYNFILMKDMTSIYRMPDIWNLSEMAYRHFLNYEDEVLYIIEMEGLEGVLSIGDLERFYENGEKELKLNREYTFITTVDYEAAGDFFKRMPTVNEIPVIMEGRFIGVIRKYKEKSQRNRQRKALKDAKIDIWQMTKMEIQRFVMETKAKVLLYIYSNTEVIEKLKGEEYEKIKNMIKMKEKNSCNSWQCLLNIEKDFFQEEYEEGLCSTMQTESGQFEISIVNGVMKISDMEYTCFRYADGCRITENNPPEADRRILFFGPCIVFGAFCRNEHTIEAYLQDCLLENGYPEWKVLNKGQYGGQYMDCWYGSLFVEELSEDDVVVIIMPDNNKEILSIEGTDNLADLSEEFLKIPSLSKNIVDEIAHCNYIVNQRLAERIYKDIYAAGFLEQLKNLGKPEKIQDYYIGWGIKRYFVDYFEQYKLYRDESYVKVGAIVMNCNPFTNGHRYLIEQALIEVDKLYVFVVEEDQSYFKFVDRLKMVETGVEKLTNVQVVPSGKYILSKDTFDQYFKKEQVEVVESMDYDIRIFGEVVAAELGIKYRFVGEEPFDKVTREYNETMKRILPEYDIKVVEVPRLRRGQDVISATTVRKALQEEDWAMIASFCPESTLSYLKHAAHPS